MTIRFLINFILVAIPIGTTLGILFGLQANRDATGQAPLFAPGPGDLPGDTGDGSGNGGFGPKPKQGLGHQVLCQKAFGFTPDSKGQEYTLNPNQWNWQPGDAGGLCMNVTYFNNATYSTKFLAPEFYVTWEYPQGPADDPVHAFPNIQIEGDALPAPINSISKMDLELEWTYAIGNGTTEASTTADLTAANVNTNVAIDMFMDADETKAQSPTEATYEVMVWFTAIGAATQPLGLAQGAITTKTLNGTSFSLYHAPNQNKQEVLTWMASKPVLSFYGDISPLINAIFQLQLPGLPSESDYLGYWSFGSEAFSSPNVVTFNVPHFSIDIETSSSSS